MACFIFFLNFSLLSLLTLASHTCLKEKEGPCNDLTDNSEVNCAPGLCCTPFLSSKCETIETISRLSDSKLTLNPDEISCGNLNNWCKGTLFKRNNYCSCRKGCDLLNNCCYDAIEVCSETWKTIDFCEVRDTTLSPFKYDNGCCRGDTRNCKNRHDQLNCLKKNCIWNLSDTQNCNIKCCRRKPGKRRFRGIKRCKKLNETECNNRNDCILIDCDQIGYENGRK